MDIKEEITLFLEKNVPTDPSKWQYYVSQAKKKFDVYPSAYANGWAAKQYKDAGGKWKTEEGEEPQHVAQALPQTKELKGKLIGEKLMQYFSEIGLKHACYQNESGDVKVIGLNKDQVKEAIDKIVKEWVGNKMQEIGLPAGVGLNLPGGSINGAPSEDDVEKMKSKLGRNESIDDRGKALLMTFNDILKHHSALRVKDYGKTTLVDVQSANVVLKLYDALSDKNKESFIKMPVPKMIQMAWHVMGKK
jgi:hypothetical protein